MCGCGEMVDTSDSKSEGKPCGFESLHPHFVFFISIKISQPLVSSSLVLFVARAKEVLLYGVQPATAAVSAHTAAPAALVTIKRPLPISTNFVPPLPAMAACHATVFLSALYTTRLPLL